MECKGGLHGFLVGIDNGGKVPGDERGYPEGYRGLMRYVFWPLEPESGAEAEALVDEGWMKYEWGTLAVRDLEFVRRYRDECERQGLAPVVLAIGNGEMGPEAPKGVKEWREIGFECASDGDMLVSYLWANGAWDAEGLGSSGLFETQEQAAGFAQNIGEGEYGPAAAVKIMRVEL